MTCYSAPCPDNACIDAIHMTEPEIIEIPLQSRSGEQVAGTATLSLYASGADARSVLLILPALGLSASYYRPFAAQLAANSVHAVVLEPRGQGDSPIRPSRSNNWGFKELLEQDLYSSLLWIESRFPEAEIIPLGHSLGGHFIGCYLSMDQDRFKRVILVACGSPWLAVYSGRQKRLLRFLNASLTTVQALMGYYPGSWFGFGGREARGVMRDWQIMLRSNRYAAAGINMDLDKGVGHYAGGVLNIRMAEDTMASETANEAVLEKYSSAQITRQILQAKDVDFKTDHFKWARHPEPVTRMIKTWLDSHEN